MAGVAGTLTTSPVRVDLSEQSATGMLKVVNEGKTRSIIQIDTVSWRQEKGDDLYTPTDDLLALPTLFELEPGERQLVRVGVRKSPESGTERAYRLYLSEVPDKSVPEKKAVRVLLRIGIPVFVHKSEQVASALHWQASCAGGILRLQASNGGKGHARIIKFSLKAKSGKKPLGGVASPSYVLAGAKRIWSLDVATCPAPGSKLALSVKTEEGLLNAQVLLDE